MSPTGKPLRMIRANAKIRRAPYQTAPAGSSTRRWARRTAVASAAAGSAGIGPCAGSSTRGARSASRCREASGGGGRVGPVEREVDPADVVVRQRVPDHQQPLLGLPQRQVPGGVPGRADDLPVGVAEPHDLAVVERLVDGVRGDGLVEVLRQAAARVAAGDGRQRPGRWPRSRRPPPAAARSRRRGRSASGC